MRTPHVNPLIQQVRNEAQLRYGSPLADLMSARHTNYSQYRNDGSIAQDTAHALQRASQLAIPQLAAIYHEADGARKDAQHQIELATGGATSPSNALSVALRGEAALAATRIAHEKASAQTDTVNRGLDAIAGLAYQKRNALANFRSTRADLMGRTRDLNSQAGAFAQSRLGDLQTAAADQAYKVGKDQQAQSNSDRTYNLQLGKLTGTNPATGKPLPATAKAPSVKPLTQNQNNAVLDHVQSVVALINGSPQFEDAPKGAPAGAKGPKLTPDRIRQHLLSGSSPLGKPVSADVLGAAWALSKYGAGHLQNRDVHTLVTRGVRIPRSWLPPKFNLPAGFRPEVAVTKR